MRDELVNPAGVAHGAVASLIDHVLGTTIMPILPAGSRRRAVALALGTIAITPPRAAS